MHRSADLFCRLVLATCNRIQSQTRCAVFLGGMPGKRVCRRVSSLTRPSYYQSLIGPQPKSATAPLRRGGLWRLGRAVAAVEPRWERIWRTIRRGDATVTTHRGIAAARGILKQNRTAAALPQPSATGIISYAIAGVSGRETVIVVPSPAALTICACPPSRSARLRMPCKPNRSSDTCDGSKPMPQSRMVN